MSTSVLLASGVVVVASVALVVLGTLFKWDLASRAYNRWTRITGAVAIIALALAFAWGRIDEPLVALGFLAGGAALAAAFVWAHRALSVRAEHVLGSPQEERPGAGA